MMNAMFGTRSFLCAPFRPPFQGSTHLLLRYPGRCPGLPWVAPLGLRTSKPKGRDYLGFSTTVTSALAPGQPRNQPMSWPAA